MSVPSAQQFYVLDGTVRWRKAEDLPPASRMISSPYDVEARYGKKRDVEWKGYKVHLTECCDAQAPMLITDVQTTHAASNDVDILPTIEAGLADREVLPDEHLVDTGYMSAPHLVAARDRYGVRLIGPVLADPSWQAKAPDGFDLSRFVIDWESKVVTCPQGEASRSWSEQKNAHGHDVVHVVFGRASCAGCPARERCTKSATGPRTLTLSARPNHEALQQARAHQTSDEFKEKYKARAGVEGTISQAIRRTGLRRSRYAGTAKTRLQHLAAATAINVLRAGAWLLDLPRATTRRSPFAALAPKAA